MAGLLISNFGGIAPIFDPRKLNDRNAEIAQDCKFIAGDIRPVYKERFVRETSIFGLVKTLYRIDDTHWLLWNEDVDVVRGPIPEDRRLYWTDGIGRPQMATESMATGNLSSYAGHPVISRPLGVPKPTTVPQVDLGPAPSGAITRVTAQNPAVVVCVSPHGLVTGQRVSIHDTSDNLVNGISADIAVLGSRKFKLMSFDGTGMGGNATGGEWRRVYRDQELEDRVYVFTRVTEFGEEGGPSEPSNLLQVGEGQSVAITLPSDGSGGPGGNFQWRTKRLYRTVTGSRSTDYFFVTEFAPGQTDFVDDLGSIDLGEILPTRGFEIPPDGMHGLVNLPNGFMAGFEGNNLYFCEPYQPHAWPPRYRQSLDYDIVGLAVYGYTLVVLTQGTPYLGTGADPASMHLSKMQTTEACIAKRTIQSMGSSVLYASPDALVQVSDAGVTKVSDTLYSPQQWRDLMANEMFGVVLEGRYYLCEQAQQVTLFDPRSGQVDVSLQFIGITAAFRDPHEDRLYGVGAITNRIYEIAGDPFSNKLLHWRSKVFRIARPMNFAYGQVIVDGPSCSFFLYVDGQFKQHVQAQSGEPFRLFSGFRASEWQVGIQSEYPVQSVGIAESADELRQLL